jgi:hypothetical protein
MGVQPHFLSPATGSNSAIQSNGSIFFFARQHHRRLANHQVNLIVPATTNENITMATAFVLRHDVPLGFLGFGLGRVHANNFELALAPCSTLTFAMSAQPDEAVWHVTLFIFLGFRLLLGSCCHSFLGSTLGNDCCDRSWGCWCDCRGNGRNDWCHSSRPRMGCCCRWLRIALSLENRISLEESIILVV